MGGVSTRRPSHQALRHHHPRRRAARGRGGRLGGRLHPVAGLAARLRSGARPRASPRLCAGAPRSAACSSTRTLDEVAGLVDGDRADDGPAARRRGPGLLRRGRAAHRREGRSRPRRCAATPTSARSRPSTPTTTCSTPTAAGCAAARGRRSTGSSSRTRRSKIPLVLSGGLRPENVAEAIARRAPVRRRHGQRHRGQPGRQGPREGRRPSSRRSARRERRPRLGAGPRAMSSCGVEHRFGPYGGQYVPETLMPALAELEEAWVAAWGDAGFRAELDGLLRDFVGRPSPLYLAQRLSEVAGRAICTSSARTSTTPARTRSTTPSARRCWPGAWASGASSPRPARASTASPPRPPARCWTSSASSTWAWRTSAARRPTSSAWSCWARACRPVEAGSAHAQGGDVGGDPRLGHQRRHHALHHRLGRRPGALPGARARPAARDRRRGARADPRARGPPARPRRRLRRRRLQRDRHLRRLRRRRRRAR